MPYNTLNTSLVNNLNLRDHQGRELPASDPRKNEAVYGLNQSNNYYFGMYLEASFFQPKDGMVSHNGQSPAPMRFEFTGDDDMFVYIDGVLVLDLGGIHDAQSGYIDFSTGVVGWTTTNPRNTPPTWHTTSIRSQFSAAGRSIAGFVAKGAGHVFSNYSSHTIQIFYMERGAYASNLRMRLNLPTLPRGDVSITKEVRGVRESLIADREYTMKLYVGDTAASAQLRTGSYKLYGENGTLLGTFNTAADGTFKLKHGQQAVFSGIQQGQHFYVEELGVENPSGIRYHVLTGDEEEEEAATIVGGVARSRTYQYSFGDAGSMYLKVINQVSNSEEVMGDITVSKSFSRTDGTGAPAGFAAVFQLWTTGSGAAMIEEVTYAQMTDGSYTFAGLLHGTYEVRETITQHSTDDEIRYRYTTVSVNGGTAQTAVSTTVTLEDSDPNAVETATVHFVNHYGTKTSGLLLQKTDQEGALLPGAVFALHQYVEDGYTLPIGTYTTGNGEDDTILGAVELSGLEDGLYRLVETQSPDSNRYIPLDAPVYFHVLDNVVTLTDESGSPLAEDAQHPDVSLSEDALTIINHVMAFVLPEAGGIGTTVFSIVGGAIILGAAAMLVLFFRRGRRRKKIE